MTIDRSLLAAAVLLWLPALGGCAGAAVGTFGTKEMASTDFVLAPQRNEFTFSLERVTYTREDVVTLWGQPDALEAFSACEVLVYDDGISWSGAGAFVGVVPVPLAVPSGRYQNRFYVLEGRVVGLVREYGEVDRMAGYMCGSNECAALAGEKVNEPPLDPDVARAQWCSPDP